MYDPDELRYKRGGGVLMLFGFPFFAMGSVMAIAGLLGKVEQGRAAGGGPASPWAVVPFAMIFVAVGAIMMFGRTGAILNRREKTVTTWWGLLVPFSRKTQPLNDSWIYLKTETRKTKNGSYTVYVVRLTAGKDLLLSEYRKYDPARADAERAAKFLDFGIADTSSGEMVRREAGTLDESLRQRLAREGTVPAMPEKPLECKVREAVEGDEALFELPPGGRLMGMLMAGVAFVPLVAFAIFASAIFSSSGSNAKGIEAFYVFVAIVGGGLLLAVGLPVLKALTTRETVAVSTRGLRLKTRWLLGSTTKQIPADELEELAVSTQRPNLLNRQGGPIVARSDTCTLAFGSGLSEDERRWLRDVILYLVTAPERPL
ncbi:MAG: hypothetical protein L6R28_08010 [Planctomycetes bacterium]|nr:hypothetical protein [Planctomycetota bacterium]